ncbi:hypothetical protein GIB67_033522 [Kingdonia uniflora]|uniref:Uncharacterized protein n=1 Tax=Kingdonia uniflora TaxID=39325 RepID=A0A7J7L6C9_9MAGN|nr:hypothetical protein GIB67_033522 [Kingdonia uniflora]
MGFISILSSADLRPGISECMAWILLVRSSKVMNCGGGIAIKEVDKDLQGKEKLYNLKKSYSEQIESLAKDQIALDRLFIE